MPRPYMGPRAAVFWVSCARGRCDSLRWWWRYCSPVKKTKRSTGDALRWREDHVTLARDASRIVCMNFTCQDRAWVACGGVLSWPCTWTSWRSSERSLVQNNKRAAQWLPNMPNNGHGFCSPASKAAHKCICARDVGERRCRSGVRRYLKSHEKRAKQGTGQGHRRKRSMMLWLLDCGSGGVLVAKGGRFRGCGQTEERKTWQWWTEACSTSCYCSRK